MPGRSWSASGSQKGKTQPKPRPARYASLIGLNWIGHASSDNSRHQIELMLSERLLVHGLIDTECPQAGIRLRDDLAADPHALRQGIVKVFMHLSSGSADRHGRPPEVC